MTPFYLTLTLKTYYSLVTSVFSIVLMIVLLVVFFQKRSKYLALKRIAYTDELTGGISLARFKIDTRRLFEKFGSESFAIANIDIDKFKYINDMFGYYEGDRTLKLLHDTLAANIGENELCTRMSADWFVLLFNETNYDKLKERIQKLFDEISAIEGPGIDHYELIVKCGIYIIEQGEKDINQMIDKAIITRETINSGHKSTFDFYSDKLRSRLIKEKDIENRMMKALENDEFVVYMQPQIDLKSGQIAGAEALVRWNHPYKGLLSPAEFLPTFEKNGFIVSVDYYVFKTVCTQIRLWLDNGYRPLPVSVNVSRLNLMQPDFVKNYKVLIREYNIPAELIELELTESAVFENQSLLLSLADEFKEAGIKMSIDDFGSGYSCLSLLGIIPFETLKIDKKLLMNNFNTDGGKIVIKKIVELAKSLNMKVVSEGVETSEQMDFLRDIECDMGQGFLFARPMPMESFVQMIKGLAV